MIFPGIAISPVVFGTVCWRCRMRSTGPEAANLTVASPISRTCWKSPSYEVSFFTRAGIVAVDGVSFSSSTAKRWRWSVNPAAAGVPRLHHAVVLDPPGRIVGGSMRLDGRDLLQLDEAAMRDVRGNGSR